MKLEEWVKCKKRNQDIGNKDGVDKRKIQEMQKKRKKRTKERKRQKKNKRRKEKEKWADWGIDWMKKKIHWKMKERKIKRVEEAWK